MGGSGITGFTGFASGALRSFIIRLPVLDSSAPDVAGIVSDGVAVGCGVSAVDEGLGASVRSATSAGVNAEAGGEMGPKDLG